MYFTIASAVAAIAAWGLSATLPVRRSGDDGRNMVIAHVAAIIVLLAFWYFK